MKFSRIRRLGAIGLLAVTLTACGISAPVAEQPTPAPAPAAVQQVVAQQSTPVDDEEACFQQLDDEQLERLEPYVEERPGSQGSVCVLEPDGEGYEQQYYQESEGFPYFWYYALMSRTSMFTTGVIGEPTLLEYITMSYWVTVDKYGHPASPYRKDSKGKWSRLKTELPKQVRQIRYGAAAPTLPNTQKTPPPPPAGYQKQPVAASTGSVIVKRDSEKQSTPPPAAKSSTSSSKSSTSTGKKGK